MKGWIRAEDFSVAGSKGVDLGGRLISSRNIVSFHFFRRISLETIGLIGIAGFTIWLTASTPPSAGAFFGCIVILAFVFLGVWRETRHSYVLVIQILQEGLFEVRGFTSNHAEALEAQLAEMTVE
jgi:hypothetical protein